MTGAAFSGSRVTRVLASSVLSQAISVMQTYLLVPLFLTAWTSEGYGRWLSLTALTSYLALLDLGGQTHVGNRLAASFARDEREEFLRTLRRGFSVFSTLALVGILVISAVLVLPFTDWDRSTRLVVFFCAVNTAIGVPGGILVTCYAATGRLDRGAWVGNAIRLMALGLSVAALLVRVDLVQYASVQLFATLVNSVILFVDLRRQIPDLFRPRWSWMSWAESAPLLRGSVPFWVFALSSALSIQGVLLVLSSVLDSASVAAYSTHRSAASLILYAGALLRPALWTELTFLSARGDYATIRQLVSLAVRSSTWFAAVVGSAICLAAPFGYAIWTRKALELDIPLLVLFAAQAILSAGWSAAAWPLMAAGQPRALAHWTLLNGALTIAGSYVALRLGGGLRALVAWSLAVDVLCGLVPFPVASFAFMQGRVSAFFRDMARAAVCALPFGALAYACFAAFHDNTSRVLGFGAGSLVVVGPCLWLLYGTRDLRRIQASVWRAIEGLPLLRK